MTAREIVILIIFSVLFAGANYVNGSRISGLKSDKAALIDDLKTASDTITKMQADQRQAAELDKRVTEELHASESENDRLRSELTAANRKLRIKAKCPVTTSSGMGDATSVELSDAAGQAVFDIRAGIIRDRAKIEYLQGYITNVCLSQ